MFFVPFHYNEQLINAITIGDFDPKSFEPNFKQCAVQLHSIKVPNGIKLQEKEIAGRLEHIVVRNELYEIQNVNIKIPLRDRLLVWG